MAKETATAIMGIRCQCGSTRHEVHRTTSTAVVLKCKACGNQTSVKGEIGVATGISPAFEDVFRPDPEKVPKKPETKKPKRRFFRVALGDDAFSTVQKALDSCAVIMGSTRGEIPDAYAASCLEMICAEFISGVDSDVRRIVDVAERASSHDWLPRKKAAKFKLSKLRELVQQRSHIRGDDALCDLLKRVLADGIPETWVVVHRNNYSLLQNQDMWKSEVRVDAGEGQQFVAYLAKTGKGVTLEGVQELIGQKIVEECNKAFGVEAVEIIEVLGRKDVQGNTGIQRETDEGDCGGDGTAVDDSGESDKPESIGCCVPVHHGEDQPSDRCGDQGDRDGE